MIGEGDRQKAASFWSDMSQNPSKRLTWGNVPRIKQHVCGLLGFPDKTAVTESLMMRAKRELGLTFPLEQGLSVGCGTGSKEIALARAGIVREWDLYEISPVRIRMGQESARRQGLEERVRFHAKDAFAEAKATYDLVFWSQSLHHMPQVDAALHWSLERLKIGGLLVIDEFVGPNRFQWTDKILLAATAARAVLDDRHLSIPEAPDKSWPRQMQRPRLADVVAADPTESIDSERIIPAIIEVLPGADVIHLGGVVYMVALSGILTNFTEEDDELLERLLRMDREFTKCDLSVMAGSLFRMPG